MTVRVEQHGMRKHATYATDCTGLHRRGHGPCRSVPRPLFAALGDLLPPQQGPVSLYLSGIFLEGLELSGKIDLTVQPFPPNGGEGARELPAAVVYGKTNLVGTRGVSISGLSLLGEISVADSIGLALIGARASTEGQSGSQTGGQRQGPAHGGVTEFLIRLQGPEAIEMQVVTRRPRAHLRLLLHTAQEARIRLDHRPPEPEGPLAAGGASLEVVDEASQGPDSEQAVLRAGSVSIEGPSSRSTRIGYGAGYTRVGLVSRARVSVAGCGVTVGSLHVHASTIDIAMQWSPPPRSTAGFRALQDLTVHSGTSIVATQGRISLVSRHGRVSLHPASLLEVSALEGPAGEIRIEGEELHAAGIVLAGAGN